MKFSTRRIYSLLACFALFFFGISLLLQYQFGLMPCSLCLIARSIMLLTGILFTIAAFHNPVEGIAKLIYPISGSILIALGLSVTARHIWILQLPPHLVPSCTPGLDYLFETLPMFEAILVVLKGAGECAESQEQFLGFSLPLWTMLAFILLGLGSIWAYFQTKKRVA